MKEKKPSWIERMQENLAIQKIKTRKAFSDLKTLSAPKKGLKASSKASNMGDHTSVINDFTAKMRREKLYNFDTFIEPNCNTSKDSDVLIRISDLEKTFHKGKKRENKVLKKISFEIRKNQNLAILGTNGAGKTTLVEILCGLIPISGGKIDYLYNYKKSFLEKIGIQFQDSSYPPGITVKEVIDFVLGIFNVQINAQKLNGLITIFGVDEFYTWKAKSLSGGQQQRLNALLAIINDPKIVFLDEISTGLDITIKKRIIEFFKIYLKENNMSLVLVSHDLNEVEYLADHIIILHEGKIVVNASTKQILHEHDSIPEFIKQYIF